MIAPMMTTGTMLAPGQRSASAVTLNATAIPGLTPTTLSEITSVMLNSRTSPELCRTNAPRPSPAPGPPPVGRGVDWVLTTLSFLEDHRLHDHQRPTKRPPLDGSKTTLAQKGPGRDQYTGRSGGVKDSSTLATPPKRDRSAKAQPARRGRSGPCARGGCASAPSQPEDRRPRSHQRSS